MGIQIVIKEKIDERYIEKLVGTCKLVDGDCPSCAHKEKCSFIRAKASFIMDKEIIPKDLDFLDIERLTMIFE